ncbi:chromate efflux transporter [Aureimonas sp. AU4]|uniref:chromate efflux transporter n=1 Tax=Aureimonas sp. AU4 TaxID=1638163 RepID=UPI0007062488|nr:chromate efflux transporter [Aureimonas sp. AU4]BAT30305.1 chromate transporter precursor [Aureimonas sp. AU4]
MAADGTPAIADPETQAPARPPGGAGEVFRAFLVLGCTSFGGPTAHLSYFRDSFVARRRWLTEETYADLVALAQFLPGPASSQVGMGVGWIRAGWAGLLAAFVGFTLPSALLMAGAALGLSAFMGPEAAGLLAGLKAAAVAVVAQALAAMASNLASGARRASIALVCGALAFFVSGPAGQLGAIALGALAGLLAEPEESALAPRSPLPAPRRRTGLALLAILALVLVLPTPLAALLDLPALNLAGRFARAGALVFGGGHVVLPLLEAETVGRGLVRETAFLAGYGLAQAVPGPLFTFATYLGALAPPGGWGGALLATGAIFLPAGLLVAGALPFWSRLRALPQARRALGGVNAAVVGLLGAAFLDPVLPAGVTSGATALVALASLALLLARAPAPLVVLGAGALGWLVL